MTSLLLLLLLPYWYNKVYDYKMEDPQRWQSVSYLLTDVELGTPRFQIAVDEVHVSAECPSYKRIYGTNKNCVGEA